MKYFPIFAVMLLLCFAAFAQAVEMADDEITKDVKIIEVTEYVGNIVNEIKDDNFRVSVVSDKNNQEQIYFQDTKTKKIYQITGISNEHRPFSNVLFRSPGVISFERYANPHHGLRYEMNLSERKLIHAKMISDENEPASSEARTIVKDKAAKAKLLGKHSFSLQWIGWKYFGTALIAEQNGILRIEAEQKSRESGDYVRMNGIVTVIGASKFGFRGTIVTQVSYINKGKPCEREGDFTFAIKGNRKYWRLQEMNNPCEGVVDYVDIYFQ